MNRLTPWFDALRGHRGGEATFTSIARAADLGRLSLRLDEPEIPVPLERSPSGRPLSLYVPEAYEPNYAYPLVVWLHGRGGDERDVLEIAPRISDRNFVAVGLRGTRPDASRSDRWAWHVDDVVDWLPELHETLCEVRRYVHVHSERIVLAGADDGAAVAIRTLLERPEWFAGAVGWNANSPETPASMAGYPEAVGKRALLGTGTRDGLLRTVRTAVTARLLRAAGLDVTQQTFDAGRDVPAEMLRDVNAWLVETACAVV